MASGTSSIVTPRSAASSAKRSFPPSGAVSRPIPLAAFPPPPIPPPPPPQVGRISTTVPYDKITDCDVLEPAGAEGCPCALVSRTMYTFTVSTASANPALEIWGIHAPYELKRDVWNMKRGQGIEGCAGSAVAPLGVSMDREAEGKEAGPSGSYDYRGGGGSMGGEACTRLLGEILATLREQNAILLRKS